MNATLESPGAELRTILETECSDLIDRLMTGAVAPALEAAVERERAANQCVLAATQAALEEKIRGNASLAESLLQSEIQVEQLQSKLLLECKNAKAAKDADESQLHALQMELDAMRHEVIRVKRQLDVEISERARLIQALKTVQQACAVVGPQVDAVGEQNQYEGTPDISDGGSTTADDDSAPDNHVSNVPVWIRGGQPTPTMLAAVRSLKLVAASEAAATSPELVASLNQLFEQIKAMYWQDLAAHESTEILARLSANLRYARNSFVHQASSEGVNGSKLFEQELSAKLEEFGATSLGRHLAIAAYELTQPEAANVRAHAS
jgi:hypothetical protein